MARQFSKPFEARTIESRARSLRLRVRIFVKDPQHWYQTVSQTQPGVVYNLVRGRWGWKCDCPGYQFTGSCKHLGQLERRADREAWSFGVIAALPQK